MKRRYMHIPRFLGLFVLLWSIAIQAQVPTSRDSYINDYAGILTAEVEANLRNRLEFHATNKNIQVHVLTLDNYIYQNENGLIWQQFNQSVFDAWLANGTLDDRSILIIADRNSHQIGVTLGNFYPEYYREIVNEQYLKSMNSIDFGTSVYQTADSIVQLTISDISFFNWYKLEFLVAFYLIFSLLVAYQIRNNQNAPLPMLLLGLFGVIVIATYNAIFGSNGYSRTGSRGRA